MVHLRGRNEEDEADRDPVGAKRPAELVHLGQALVVGAIEQELDYDIGVARLRARLHEMTDVGEDLVKDPRRDLHHPVVVRLVHRVQGDDHLAGLVVDEPPRDFGIQERAVGRQVVHDHAPRVEVIQEFQDIAVEEGISAAGDPDRLQPRLGQLVHERAQVLDGDLVLGADVLLVAEVAGDVAAVGQVDLGVDRPLRRLPGNDRLDDLPLPLPGDLRPPVTARHGRYLSSLRRAGGALVLVPGEDRRCADGRALSEEGITRPGRVDPSVASLSSG